MPIGSKQLQMVVREPYTPPGKVLKLTRINVRQGESLSVQSKMDDAALFLDGPYKKNEVFLGDVVTFRASDEPLKVLGLNVEGRPR